MHNIQTAPFILKKEDGTYYDVAYEWYETAKFVAVRLGLRKNSIGQKIGFYSSEDDSQIQIYTIVPGEGVWFTFERRSKPDYNKDNA